MKNGQIGDDTLELLVFDFENGVKQAIPRDIINTASYQNASSQGKYDEDVRSSSGKWAMWGKNDDLPTRWRQKIESCDIAGATIGKITEMMWGDGIYWSAEWNGMHKEGLSDEINAEIEEWVIRNRIDTHYLPGQFADYRMYMNTFSELWWDDTGKKIAGISHKPAEHCRLGLQNNDGRITEVIYSPYFAIGATPSEDRRKEIPYLDWDINDPLNHLSGKNFIDHAYYPTVGMTYYAHPWWAGLFRDDGWITVSSNIPRLINLIHQNKARLLYIIYIPMSYFKLRDPNFDTYDAEDRKRIMDDKVAEINTTLKDSDNYYTSLASYFEEEPGNNNPYGKILVEPVAQNSTKDDWMPDSNISDAKIVQGLGLHPSQMGLAPEGGKMGAGSGSDQRESFNTQNVLVTVHEAIILSRLNNIVSKVNGWGAKFWIGKERHVTKDINKTGVSTDIIGKKNGTE